MVAAQTGTGSKATQADADSQADYQPTPWEDASWEIVGEVSGNDDFVPMAITVAARESEEISDPMFPDYGGHGPVEGTARWHLPDQLAGQYQGSAAGEDEEQGNQKIRDEELDRIREEAFQRGVEQGRADAQAEEAGRLSEMQERTNTLMQDLSTQVTEACVEIERQAVELSLSVARKIIEQAVEINPEYIVKLLHEALAQAGSAVVKTIRVSPEDLEFIEFAGVEARLRERDSQWRFLADPSVRAGCILETSAGEIDFQLDHAWERVRDQVVKVIR